MVRVAATLALALIAVTIATVPTMAQQRQTRPACPSDAYAASRDVWPIGSVRTGERVQGVHPCGRRLTCTGGTLSVNRSRTCRWL